jgi:hypothetical protein
MTSKTLHITNGDCTSDLLKQTKLEGDIIVYSDVLHEGPTPAGLEPEQWRKVRAQYFSDQGWATYDDFMDYHTRLDEALAKFSDYSEIILWLEHDLFDQLILIRLLDWFSKQDLGNTKLGLICIGEFPGIQRFIGLGQLSPEQITSLYGTQHKVTIEEFDLAKQAWSTFCAKDPSDLNTMIKKDLSTLPFLKNALLRHLEQYPSLENGLSRTDQQILEVIESGIHKRGEIFKKVRDLEESPFMGDTIFWSYLDNLLEGKEPLLRAGIGSLMATNLGNESEEQKFLNQPIHITPKSREVLQGKADWVILNGINRWLGGVRLYGKDSSWRWDNKHKNLVHIDVTPL